MLINLKNGHMPFFNGSGLIACTNSGIITHEYFGSRVEITSWQPRLIIDACNLSHLLSKIIGFSVVCNPIIGNGFISFTGCILEPDKPASYHLYKVTERGVARVSNRVTFSGFWTPREDVKVLDYNSFSCGSRKKTLKGYEQIVRIVPCHDQFLSKFDPIILTILDERNGSYKSVLYRRTDDSFWSIKDDSGNEVYKPTIYNGKMIHVKRDGSERFLLETPYHLE